MANFDYTKDDVEELANELFNDFCDNYEGLMSKTVAIAVVRRLAKELKESDFSVSD